MKWNNIYIRGYTCTLSHSLSFSCSCYLSHSLSLILAVCLNLSFSISLSFSRSSYLCHSLALSLSSIFLLSSFLLFSLLFYISYHTVNAGKRKKRNRLIQCYSNTLYPYINRRHWKGSSGTKEVILPHLIPSVQPLHNLKDVLYSPSLFLIVNLHSQCWKSNRSAKDAL